jgi:hypothetical protein
LGYEVINLGVGNPISMTEFVEIIEELLGKTINKVSVETPLSDPPITYCANSSALTCRSVCRRVYSAPGNGSPISTRFVEIFSRKQLNCVGTRTACPQLNQMQSAVGASPLFISSTFAQSKPKSQAEPAQESQDKPNIAEPPTPLKQSRSSPQS